MPAPFLYIALGAIIGALIRYSLYKWGLRFFDQFPLGTLVANLLGCFLFGFLVFSIKPTNYAIKVALLTGFLGSLTTFSTFSFEVVQMLN